MALPAAPKDEEDVVGGLTVTEFRILKDEASREELADDAVGYVWNAALKRWELWEITKVRQLRHSKEW